MLSVSWFFLHQNVLHLAIPSPWHWHGPAQTLLRLRNFGHSAKRFGSSLSNAAGSGPLLVRVPAWRISQSPRHIIAAQMIRWRESAFHGGLSRPELVHRRRFLGSSLRLRTFVWVHLRLVRVIVVLIDSYSTWYVYPFVHQMVSVRNWNQYGMKSTSRSQQILARRRRAFLHWDSLALARTGLSAGLSLIRR